MDGLTLTVFVNDGVTATLHENLSEVEFLERADKSTFRIRLLNQALGRLLEQGMRCLLAFEMQEPMAGRINRLNRTRKGLECEIKKEES